MITFLPDIEEYTIYLEQIWQAGQLTNNGPLCRQLGKDLASFLGTSNLEMDAKSTLALQL